MFRPFALCCLIFAVAAPALAGLAPSGPGRVHLEEVITDRKEPTRFGGTVYWSNDTIKRADGSSEMVARADVAIPERRMKVRLLFQNDTGSGLLGQTIQVSFEVPSDFAGGKGVREIQELRMRETETSIGFPFGRAVQKIRDGVFLIGIARDVLTEATSFNRKDWDWITLPLVYGDDQRAQLVIEKGHDGQQAITAMNEQNEKLKLPSGAASVAAAPMREVKMEPKPEPAKPLQRTDPIADAIKKQLDVAPPTKQPSEKGKVGMLLVRRPSMDQVAATHRAFLESLERMKGKLSQCWRPEKDFKGSLRYRVALDKDGKVKSITPFADNKGDNGADRTATTALQSCQPYDIPSSHSSSSLEVVLSQQIEIVPLADAATEQPAKPAILVPDAVKGPHNLTIAELGKLRTQIEKCTTTMQSGSAAAIELNLNPDGSVAPSSRVISSTSPELGRNLLQATYQCQPYSLPAEKYDGWKSVVLEFR